MDVDSLVDPAMRIIQKDLKSRPSFSANLNTEHSILKPVSTETIMPRGKTFDNATAAIGDTPMIKINRLVPADHATVFANASSFNRSIASKIAWALR